MILQTQLKKLLKGYGCLGDFKKSKSISKMKTNDMPDSEMVITEEQKPADSKTEKENWKHTTCRLEDRERKLETHNLHS